MPHEDQYRPVFVLADCEVGRNLRAPSPSPPLGPAPAYTPLADGRGYVEVDVGERLG